MEDLVREIRAHDTNIDKPLRLLHDNVMAVGEGCLGGEDSSGDFVATLPRLVPSQAHRGHIRWLSDAVVVG